MNGEDRKGALLGLKRPSNIIGCLNYRAMSGTHNVKEETRNCTENVDFKTVWKVLLNMNMYDNIDRLMFVNLFVGYL